MNSRFLTNTALIALGAFTVVASVAFGASTFMWIMLGAGILAAATVAGAAVGGRGRAQRGLDLTAGALGAWTIVASLVFSGFTVTALGFASGCGIAALAIAGLFIHELSTERVVHSLDVIDSSTLDPELAPIQG